MKRTPKTHSSNGPEGTSEWTPIFLCVSTVTASASIKSSKIAASKAMGTQQLFEPAAT